MQSHEETAMADEHCTGKKGVVVSDAVQAFHTIYRLAVMCSQEITHRTTEDDGDALLLAIRDIAEKHGRSLDEHPDSTGLGVFESSVEANDDEVSNG
jgi:hypothetical protein